MWKCEEEGVMCKTGKRLEEGRDYGCDEGGKIRTGRGSNWQELGGGSGRGRDRGLGV